MFCCNVRSSVERLLFLIWIFSTTVVTDNVVNTPSGPIKGTTSQSVTGKEVDVFYGIPFAKPPVGSLRFGPPVPVEPWTEELDATSPSLGCYQRLPANMRGFSIDKKADWFSRRPWSEDCLKLHIWVPKPRPEKAAVMVYIHGGGYFAGDPLAPMLHGSTLASEENVIFVSMNYRLHSFGFAYLGIPEVPGNVGLMDQQLALKWVRDNIASFGGNPDEVTIFGLSAGGASVGFQVLTPSNKNLFKRAILMSGAPSASWSLITKEQALERTMKMAAFVGCRDEDIKNVYKCLQSVHPEEFMEFVFGPWDFHHEMNFCPIVDGEFVPDTPANILRDTRDHSVSVMIGETSDEGASFLLLMYPENFIGEDARVKSTSFLDLISRAFKTSNSSTQKMLAFLYTNWTNPEDEIQLRDGIKDLVADAFFRCPAQEFADLFEASGGKVYRYVVNFKKDGLIPLAKWMRAVHGSDAVLHMGLAAQPNELFSEEDSKLSRTVMKWWANFARTGNPNSDNLDATKWPKFSKEKKEYIVIDLQSTIEKNYRIEQCGLLNSVLNSENPNIKLTFIED